MPLAGRPQEATAPRVRHWSPPRQPTQDPDHAPPQTGVRPSDLAGVTELGASVFGAARGPLLARLQTFGDQFRVVEGGAARRLVAVATGPDIGLARKLRAVWPSGHPLAPLAGRLLSAAFRSLAITPLETPREAHQSFVTRSQSRDRVTKRC